MELTPRIKQILQFVLEKNEPVLEQDIAQHIGVSKRTVQREFDYIAAGLADYDLSLCKKKNIGVWIDGDAVNLERLRKEITETPNNDFSDKNTRRKYLIYELLREKVPKKLFYFSNLFGVSEATISHDLDVVEKKLLEYRLSLIRKPGYGVIVDGKEKDIRTALHHFVNENIDDESIRNMFFENREALLKAMKNYNSVKVYGILNSSVVDRVINVFEDISESRFNHMAEDSYIGLLLHTAIAVDRIMKGNVIEDTDLPGNVQLDDDYPAAAHLIEALESEFDIKLPKSEFSNILLYIKGSKQNRYNLEDEEELGAEKLLDIIDKLIGVFDATDACEMRQDDELIYGLMMDLQPAIVRIENELYVYNPLEDQIKSEYPEVFAQCRQAAYVIEKATGHKVPDSEVGYLAIHFGAAMERIHERKRRRRPVEIGIVCAGGFGVARLMSTKIRGFLREDVTIKTYGRDELTPYVASKTDFFVSGLVLDNPDIDVVKVSPLINANDIMAIRLKVDEYSRMPSKQEDIDFNEQLSQINEIVSKIKRLIKNYSNYRADSTSTMEQLVESMSYIITDSRAAADTLKNDIMKRERVMTQVFPELDFALFHCKTKAVSSIVFKTMTPEDGACFTDESMKNIKAAVFLAAPMDKGETNTDILGRISSAFVEEERLLPSIFEENVEETRRIIKKALKTYFNEYISKMQ